MIKNTRLRKAWKFCWRWVKIALVTMFLSSLVYIVICKWVFPPITVTQISNTIKYGIYKEYVPWNQISNNVKLAALASEDQGTGWTRYLRKIPEVYFTKMIEWIWGKQRIMEVYLNVIEMGPGVFGIEAAAESNFNKHASQLTETQAAQIIACLPNPKKFFVVHPQSRRVAWRYPQILREMNNLRDDEDIDDFLKH